MIQQHRQAIRYMMGGHIPDRLSMLWDHSRQCVSEAWISQTLSCDPRKMAGSCFLRVQTGGPLKPSFGLSGAVRPPDTIFRLPVRAFSPSIRTQSPPFRRTRLRTDESCSTANLPHAHTIRAARGCDGYNEAFPRTGHDSGC